MIDQSILDKLKNIVVGNESVDTVCNTVRSIHRCSFCDNKEVDFKYEGKTEYLGMDEILIPSANGKHYFSAPSMVVHYIEEHNYCPDHSFLDAVNSFDMSQKYNAQEIFNTLTND